MTDQNTAISTSSDSVHDARTSPLSLRKNFTWTFAGNMVYAASQWGVLVVLAKLGSPEMVGQFALGLAITAPVILFANLQLRSVQATDARSEYTFADYLGLRLLSTLAAYVAIIAIVTLSGYRQETALVILLIGLAKCFEAVSDVIFGLLQQHERMDRIAKSLMIEGPVTLVVMGIILYLTGSVGWAVAGMALVWGLQLALYDLRNARLILRSEAPGSEWRLMRPRFDHTTLRRLGWLALPLGFVMLLISLNANIPRYFIENQLGQKELGVFAALAYLMVAGTTVTSALGQSASPRLAKYYAQGDRINFLKLLGRLLGIGLALGLAGVVVVFVAGREILNVFYGTEYAARSDVFILIMISSGVSYLASFLGYGITAARYFKIQPLIALVMVFTTTFISASLISQYQLVGVAIAIIVSTILQIIILIIVNLRLTQVLHGKREYHSIGSLR